MRDYPAQRLRMSKRYVASEGARPHCIICMPAGVEHLGILLYWLGTSSSMTTSRPPVPVVQVKVVCSVLDVRSSTWRKGPRSRTPTNCLKWLDDRGAFESEWRAPRPRSA